MTIECIFCGGTVTSKIEGIGKGLTSDTDYIHETILEFLKTNNIKYHFLLNKLSENLTLTDYKLLVNYLTTSKSEYIILFHGTDKLTFSAKFLHNANSLKNKTICYIGTQRSPEMPTFEGLMKLELVQKYIKTLKKGVYITNYESENSVSLLDALASEKKYSYRKNCFTGTVNYICTVNKCQSLKTKSIGLSLDYTNLVRDPSKIICIYPLEGLTTRNIPIGIEYVLLISTGLGNLGTFIYPIFKNTNIQFYLVNNTIGPKGLVYQNKSIKEYLNVKIKSDDVDTAYIRLLYDPSY
jgi:L-asparaginase/Glu-tRNA(Gln) amidotransferase subunit D